MWLKFGEYIELDEALYIWFIAFNLKKLLMSIVLELGESWISLFTYLAYSTYPDTSVNSLHHRVWRSDETQ